MLDRLADELDLLDAAAGLDLAVRARTVARVCAVALAAYRQAGAEPEDDERWDYSALTDRELATLQRLLSKGRRAQAEQGPPQVIDLTDPEQKAAHYELLSDVARADQLSGQELAAMRRAVGDGLDRNWRDQPR
jgi:hypothetical protein